MTHYVRLSAALALIVSSFGLIATTALIVPVLTLAALLGAAVVAGHR